MSRQRSADEAAPGPRERSEPPWRPCQGRLFSRDLLGPNSAAERLREGLRVPHTDTVQEVRSLPEQIMIASQRWGPVEIK